MALTSLVYVAAGALLIIGMIFFVNRDTARMQEA